MTAGVRHEGPGSELGPRFWIASVLAAIAAALCLLTLVWPDWIEALGIEPDGGDGSAELIVAGAFAAAALVAALLARVEWRRRRLAAAPVA